MKIKKCLIFEYKELPEHLKKDVRGWNHFGNDRHIHLPSEFHPEEGETWKDLSEEGIVEYWKEQAASNHYKHDLEQFVIDYGLQFERWILEQKIDLSEVEEILVRICW